MMKNKINIAEILKDCPKGTKLYSPLCGECYFDSLNMGTIICKKQNTQEITFTSGGYYMLPVFDDCECQLFPSKDQRDWSKFELPCEFKDGDIVATTNGRWIGITTGGEKGTFIPTYCVIQCDDKFEAYLDRKGEWAFNRLATKEEKEKLFQAIKENGYSWNPETKTLEKLIIKPKFKVGDRIRLKENHTYTYTITGIREKENKYECGVTFVLRFSEHDDWELVPNKFDVTTLKPLQPVLVRDTNGQVWTMDLFSHKIDTNKRLRISFACVGHYPNQCIPFEGNEHLLGTINDCDEYYKNW